jgi:hypothetical protein
VAVSRSIGHQGALVGLASFSKVFLTYISLVLVISATLLAVRYQMKYVHAVFMFFLGGSILMSSIFLFMYEYPPVTAACRASGCADLRSSK